MSSRMSVRLTMTLAIAVAAVVITALLPTTIGALGADRADAAVLRSYWDGPVLYLNKGETRYAGKSSVAGSAALLGALGGPGWAGAGAAAASIADTYIDQQVSRGYCLLVKMWWWNPRSTSVAFYSWWPCY